MQLVGLLHAAQSLHLVHCSVQSLMAASCWTKCTRWNISYVTRRVTASWTIRRIASL